MPFESVRGPQKVLDNGESTTVQMIVNSAFGMEKLLCSRRGVELYSELMWKLVCAMSEASFCFGLVSLDCKT